MAVVTTDLGKHIAVLEAHQRWRRGQDECNHSPQEIGEAIDALIAEASLRPAAAGATDDQCVALYMSLHVSTLHLLPASIAPLWERGQALRCAANRRLSPGDNDGGTF